MGFQTFELSNFVNGSRNQGGIRSIRHRQFEFHFRNPSRMIYL